jgi:AraC family transcriptional regulator
MQQTIGYSVGEESCIPVPRKRVAEKRYLQSALGVVLAGCFDYRAQNGQATAVPGTVIFGNSAEYFRCHARDTLGNRRQVVHFKQELLTEVAEERGLKTSHFKIAALPPGRLSVALAGAMRRLALGGEDHDAAAYELADAALRLDHGGSFPGFVSSRNQQRVFSVIRHLQSHYHESCSLKRLAGLARLSPYHFLRIFRKVTGQSPAQYVLNVRLRAAADSLLDTRAPIGEIALGTGFNDISHFNASFRSAFRRSPTQWRVG